MSADLVWGVTSGSYSDYTVLCICPTKEDAKQVAAKLRDDEGGWHHDARIEAFKTADASIEMATVYSITVELWDDGTSGEPVAYARLEWPFDAPPQPNNWRWVRAPIHQDKGGRLAVRGYDLEQVRRVFSDRRAQLLAEPATMRRKEWKGTM